MLCQAVAESSGRGGVRRPPVILNAAERSEESKMPALRLHPSITNNFCDASERAGYSLQAQAIQTVVPVQAVINRDRAYMCGKPLLPDGRRIGHSPAEAGGD